MPLILQPDGSIIEGPVPPGAVKVLALVDGRFREIYAGTGGGGDIPAGAAVMSDSIAFFAELGLSDSIATPTDSATFFLDAFYTDSTGTPTETARFEVSGYNDSNAGHSEARTSVLTRWATTNSVVGSVTNPTNAQAENNGTVATVKSAGTVTGTISTLNLNIVAPLTGSGSTPTFKAWYNNITGVADTFVNQLSYRQTGSGTNTVITLPTGNFLTTPYTIALTNVDSAVTMIATFSHTAAVAATGGSTTVDAVGIESSGVI